MDHTSITVVIPVKDDAPQLLRCLRALRPQLGVGDELIVVDNGSTDDSAHIARDFGARVVLVEGGGIPAASAAGYDAAGAPIIARLDADCIPGDDWIATVRREFGNSPTLSAITGPARFLDGPRLARGPLAVVYLGAYYASLFPALARVPLFGSNCAFRTEVWRLVRDGVHRGDPDVHDDLDLSFHLAAHQRVRFVRGLRMGISMRPLFDRRALVVRFRRGAHTVLLHWPRELPWFRWLRRIDPDLEPADAPSTVV